MRGSPPSGKTSRFGCRCNFSMTVAMKRMAERSKGARPKLQSDNQFENKQPNETSHAPAPLLGERARVREFSALVHDWHFLARLPFASPVDRRTRIPPMSAN